MAQPKSLMPLTRRDMNDLYPRMRESHRQLESDRDPQKRQKSTGENLIQTIETTAGAAGVGFLAGRLGTTTIGTSGVPLGLALGVAGKAVALFAGLGHYSSHVDNLADGAIAGWAALWGVGQGRQMRSAAGQPVGPITAGAQANIGARQPPQLHPQPMQMGHVTPLSEAELQIIAQEQRHRSR